MARSLSPTSYSAGRCSSSGIARSIRRPALRPPRRIRCRSPSRRHAPRSTRDGSSSSPRIALVPSRTPGSMRSSAHDVSRGHEQRDTGDSNDDGANADETHAVCRTRVRRIRFLAPALLGLAAARRLLGLRLLGRSLAAFALVLLACALVTTSGALSLTRGKSDLSPGFSMTSAQSLGFAAADATNAVRRGSPRARCASPDSTARTSLAADNSTRSRRRRGAGWRDRVPVRSLCPTANRLAGQRLSSMLIWAAGYRVPAVAPRGNTRSTSATCVAESGFAASASSWAITASLGARRQ